MTFKKILNLYSPGYFDYKMVLIHRDIRGLERWLRSYEHLILLLKIIVKFLAPTCSINTVCSSRSRDLMAFCLLQESNFMSTCMHKTHTNIHKSSKNYKKAVLVKQQPPNIFYCFNFYSLSKSFQCCFYVYDFRTYHSVLDNQVDNHQQ